MPRTRMIISFLALCLFAPPVLAQTGAIHIVVLDATDDSPLPGASVTVSNEQGLVASTTLLTDKDGLALFPVLRAGIGYAIDVQMPGFATQRRASIRLRSNSTEALQFRLGAPLEERVQVIGGRDLVDIDEVGASTRFSDKFIEALPTIGRFYQELLKLTPGVNDEDGDGNPNVHGARSRDFRTEVGGVSNVDPLTGQWLSRINPDTIEELEVIPRGAGVEFGRAQGGFARILQKQGSNTFEGSFNFLYRSSQLDGDGAGNNSRDDSVPSFETIQPSFQISGPIKKDKLWFRLSHEYIKREDPVNLLGQIEVTTFEQMLNSDQLTWQVSPRNKLALQYQNDPLSQDGLDLNSSVPLESTRKLERGGDTWSLTWTAPYSPRLLFESTLAWQDVSVDVIPTARDDELIEQQCMVFHSVPSLLRTRCENVTTGKTSGPHFERSEDERQRFTVRSQGTYFASAFGHSHRLKFGFVIEEEEYSRDLQRKPDITFEISVPPLGEPTGAASIRVALPHVSDAKAEATNWGIYLEDQWKPLSNLSITLGLRLDHEEIQSLGHQQIDPSAEAAEFGLRLAEDGRPPEEIPRFQREVYARETFTVYEDIRALRQLMGDAIDRNLVTVRLDDTMQEATLFKKTRDVDEIRIENNNFAPRLSIAWDPWADGKTKIAATAGRYYDKIFLAVPLVELEPIETTLDFSGELHFPAPPFFFETEEQFATITPVSARTVDRDLRTPYQDEYSFGIEREMSTETSLKLTWLRRKFEDQLQDVDINQAPGDFGFCTFTGEVEPSPGEGQAIWDPLNWDTYIDTDPGIGDGRLDDCQGGIDPYGTGSYPDGRPDSYLLNPTWRELLVVGNFNTSDYRAIVLEVVRRLHRNWQLDASYTWSEAEGDAEDFDLLLGNAQNRREDERGWLDYDQRHVVKLNVASFLQKGWRLGGVMRWESGLPYSIVSTTFETSPLPPLYPFDATGTRTPRYRFPTGQRNDKRNPSFWTFDVRAAKEFRFGRNHYVGLSAEVFNLLNDDVLEVEQRTGGLNIGTRRFGRRWQLGLKLAF